MAAIDKLIDLLEQIKQTDPGFGEKASKAIDVLIGTDDEKEKEVATPVPPPIPVEIEPEEIVEEIIEYPDVVEINSHDLREIRDEQKAITDKITELGLLLQNYESDKERILEYVEQKQKYFVQFLVDLQSKYNLDPDEKYVINLPQKDGDKATFVKKQS